MAIVAYRIRRARLDDFQRITEILQRVGHYNDQIKIIPEFKEKEHYFYRLNDSLEVFKKSLNNPEELPLVAVVGEKVVGTMTKVAQFGGYGYQGRFAVEPDYQRQGIGTALSKAAEQFLKSRGAKKLFVHIRDNNDVSVNFAIMHGYTMCAHSLYDKNV
jgi:ribosomal protein S18 acetylase RimI-like enzyme